MALVKSVDRFDPVAGVDFAAFATRTIIGELKRHFRDKGWAVRASRRVQELYLELGHADRAPWSSSSVATRPWPSWPRPPGPARKRSSRRSKPARATAPRPSTRRRAKTTRCSARLGEHDGNYDSVEDRALLGPALATLPEREQAILRMRFVDGLTQSEIAAAVGVSQMHVSRLLTSSLQKLREGIGQTEVETR